MKPDIIIEKVDKNNIEVTRPKEIELADGSKAWIMDTEHKKSYGTKRIDEEIANNQKLKEKFQDKAWISERIKECDDNIEVLNTVKEEI